MIEARSSRLGPTLEGIVLTPVLYRARQGRLDPGPDVRSSPSPPTKPSYSCTLAYAGHVRLRRHLLTGSRLARSCSHSPKRTIGRGASCISRRALEPALVCDIEMIELVDGRRSIAPGSTAVVSLPGSSSSISAGLGPGLGTRLDAVIGGNDEEPGARLRSSLPCAVGAWRATHFPALQYASVFLRKDNDGFEVSKIPGPIALRPPRRNRSDRRQHYPTAEHGV